MLGVSDSGQDRTLLPRTDALGGTILQVLPVSDPTGAF